MPLDKLNAALAESLNAPASEPAGTTEAPQTAPETAAPAAPETVETKAPPAPTEQPARARGPDGKFAPTTQPPAQKQPPAQAQPAGQQKPAAAQDTGGPAPRTWAPAAREHWSALPREVKDQVLKVEGLASRAHNELQQVKQGYQAFQEAVAPFVPHLQAIGIEPARAVRELFQMEYVLRTGTPTDKAGLLAHLMGRYGVTPDALATRLESAPQQPQAHPQEFRDPRLDAVLGQFQQAAQRRASETTARAQQELTAFQATNPEFLDDVADDMADLIARARQRGQPITLQQAYDKACQLNDDVRTVVEQRRAQEAQRAQSQKAAQARYVAGSVQTEPAPPTNGRRPGINGLFDALQQNLGG